MLYMSDNYALKEISIVSLIENGKPFLISASNRPGTVLLLGSGFIPQSRHKEVVIFLFTETSKRHEFGFNIIYAAR